ncbi:MAG TPA: IS1595 family transposase [Gemmatimonadaceae bacterium]|jgi:transposase-like protein|nr:IS1595 family transposase [Gemmatimonadaceae bacterium]
MANRKAGTAKTAVLANLPRACSDERTAVEFFEAQRWGSAPNCPHCGDTDVVMMKAKDGSRNARYLWRCHGCKQQFTVKVGTIMEGSPVPLRHWAYAFYEACKSKKGVSAKEIERQCHVTYKTALFMMHRIRWAMAPANANEPKLGQDGGIVEYDETFVGGKPRGLPNYMAHLGHRKMGMRPDFKERKTPVVAGIERGGRVKARVVDDTKAETLGACVREMVDPSATLMTDEKRAYEAIGRDFAAHHTIKHYRGRWADGDVTTNRIEAFWALLKRQILGTHHSVSKKHLHRYVSEVEFKFNTRGMDDGQRTVLAIQSADNKRLTYRKQVDG